MKNDFAVLAIDLNRDIERYVKEHERGCALNFWDGAWQQSGGTPVRSTKEPRYPSRTLRAGIDNIVDTVRLAQEYGLPTFASAFELGYYDGKHLPCTWLEPYVLPLNRYEKTTYSAFASGGLKERLGTCGIRRLLIIGYDRDICVFQTAVHAVTLGFTVYTSESCMLTSTQDHQDIWTQESQRYFARNTVCLNGLAEVWNVLLAESTRHHD